MTGSQVNQRGLKIASTNPKTGEDELIDTATGRIEPVATVSPDPGFATNPGKDWWQQTEQLIRDRLKSYPPELAKMVEAELQEVLDKKRP